MLRHVRPYGELDPALAALPAPIDRLPGNTTAIPLAALRSYLRAHQIEESEIGGSLESPLSHAKAGDPQAPPARYFVIHDTSTPALGRSEFPSALNSPTWRHNKIARWQQGARSKAHVFISRTGLSVTAVDFSEPWRATKFEMHDTLLRRKGLFLHIEMVQPRRRDPDGPARNQARAPIPGLTPAQYDRLAVVYVAASVRAGTWLVPAFHAVLDAGRIDGHDDPQNFEIDAFASSVTRLLSALEAPAP